ncbi:MAG: hypothetical protein CM15mP128_1280 [Methanobacteriota archaeon]|nr:MAG: hypothetical protein CM15mP128_1280 [Euryarchaeota archaeon]
MAGMTWRIVDAKGEKSELLVIPTKKTWHRRPVAPANFRRCRKRSVATLVVCPWGGPILTFPFPAHESSSALDVLGLGQDGPDLAAHPLDATCRSLLAEAVIAHVEATGDLPTERRMTVEQRDDAVVLNSRHGTLINEALGQFLLAMASTKTALGADWSSKPPAFRFKRAASLLRTSLNG